jgi:hypothetical protein
MQRLLAACLLFGCASLVNAAALEELKLLSEQPVSGISSGNLSGLAWCDGALWAVSDRDDSQLYRLHSDASQWQATAEHFVAPPAPDMRLPWGMHALSWAAGLLRGGVQDFEGLSCDAAGNRYLLSETHAAVLQLPRVGEPNWLKLPLGLVRQARASGMLLHHNALLEGVAVDPAGERLYLAAERKRRGLLVAHKQRTTWRCTGGCVLLSEAGSEQPPEQLAAPEQPKDFAGLSFYNEKLFTLERLAHRICRRSLSTGEVERCWSFAAEALTPERLYPPTYGLAEALWVDQDGAWIGVDNGNFSRADGELRPIIWRFAAPQGGWGRKP